MHLLPIIAPAIAACGSGFDQMLQLFGIAAIVFAFFKGVQLLIPKPTSPPPNNPPPAVRPPPDAPPATIATPASAATIDPEILAVIVAAVAATVATPHRIISILSQSSNWAQAGRQSILSSHKIR